MSENYEIKCIKCGHVWTVRLGDLEKVTTLYKSGDNLDVKAVKSEQYRAQCPICGTYNILEFIEGDDHDPATARNS